MEPAATRTLPAPPAMLGLRFLLGFGLLAIGPSLVWDGLVQRGLVDAGSSVAQQFEGSMLGWVVTCAGIALLAKFQPPALAWRPAHYGKVLAVYVPFLLVWVAFLIGYLALARRLGSPVPMQPALAYLAAGQVERPGFWLVVFGTVVGAPVAEEIVFRGYLQGALLGVLPRWPAILTSAAVFGLVHTGPYALPVGLLGACFGWLACRTGSLLPSILAHATHNGLTVAVTVWWPGHLDLLYPR